MDLCIILLLICASQLAYYQLTLDRRCRARQEYRSASINALVVNKTKTQDPRVSKLYLQDRLIGGFVMDYVDLPWQEREGVFIGDRLRAKVKFRNFCTKSIYSNSFRKKLDGYQSYAYLKNKESLLSSSNLRGRLVKSTISKFGLSREVSILLAVTLGVKDYLSKEVRELFASTGTSHLLVVSGYHLGLVFSIVYGLVSASLKHLSFLYYVTSIKIPSCIFALSISFLYLRLLSFTPTATRAFVALATYALIKILDRKVGSLRVFLIVAIVIVSIFPLSFLTPGFQLSFSAVLGIVLSLKIRHKFFDQKVSKYKNMFMTLVLINFSASIFTWPVLYFWFSDFVPLAPINNLLFSPLFSLLVIAFGDVVFFLFALFPFAFDELIIFLLFLISCSLEYIRWLAN